MSARIQFRRGTSEEWTSLNPVLAAGEGGVEEGTGRMKIGDGVTPWVALPYTAGPGVPSGINFGQPELKALLRYSDPAAASMTPSNPLLPSAYSGALCTLSPGSLSNLHDQSLDEVNNTTGWFAPGVTKEEDHSTAYTFVPSSSGFLTCHFAAVAISDPAAGGSPTGVIGYELAVHNEDYGPFYQGYRWASGQYARRIQFSSHNVSLSVFVDVAEIGPPAEPLYFSLSNYVTETAVAYRDYECAYWWTPAQARTGPLTPIPIPYWWL